MNGGTMCICTYELFPNELLQTLLNNGCPAKCPGFLNHPAFWKMLSSLESKLMVQSRSLISAFNTERKGADEDLSLWGKFKAPLTTRPVLLSY